MGKFLNKYPLEERTALLSEKIITLCKKVPKSIITNPIIDQLIRSGLSIGANYCEANGASSKKDFMNKIFICKKEGKETMYWLRILATTVKNISEECRILYQEVHELVMIFTKIVYKLKNSI